ncbi:MAG: PIN domain-containing protein [Nanoarchaeota archaeon]|nr:PIN domain-containing protein [Nanoarchaeota archaeon]
MFADTDFLIALIKDSDWLKKSALKILKENKGKITTSISVMIELALVCKRLKINVLDAFANIFELVNVNEEEYSICMQAAVYVEKYNVGVFDSFNAAFCGKDEIISSDSVYDIIGLQRIKLEK